MTDKSLSLLDKIVNHTGKTARQLELLENYFKSKESTSTSTTNTTSATQGSTTNNIKQAEQSSKALIESSKAISGISSSLLKYAIVPSGVKNNFIDFLERYVKVINKKISETGSETLVNSLGMIGNSLAHIQVGVQGFSKLKKKDEQRIFDFITKLIDTLSKNQKKLSTLDKNKTIDKLLNVTKSFSDIMKSIKMENIEKGSKILKRMAFSILGFATGIVLGGSILLASTVILLPVVAVLIGLTKVFTFIGRYSRLLERGGNALKTIGVSMIFMAGGLALLGLVIAINPLGTLASIAVIAMTGLVYYFIGAGWKNIVKGSIAVGFMSISMVFFALGIWSWSKLNISFTDQVLPMVGSLLLMGLTWSILGLAIELIIPGSIAVGLIGASAWVLGKVMGEITKLKIEKDSIENFSSLAFELIKVYAAAGLASILIIPGSLGMMAIGASLSSLSTGLKSLESLDMNKFDPEKLAKIITGVSGAFAAAGSTDGQKFNLFTFISGIELGPNAVKRGIDATLNAGAALTSIAQGLNSFQKLTAGIIFDISDPRSITKKIVEVTASIGYVFAMIGRDANEGTSLWKIVFGTDFKKSDTELGIRSVRNVGDTLTSIAKGVAAFSDLKKMGIKDNDFDSSVKGSIANNIGYVVGMIHSVFASIGQSGNGGTSLWKDIFGTDFSKTDTEIGIQSVKGVGGELESIAKSLATWKDLSKLGVTTADFDLKFDSYGRILPGNLISNIAFVVGAISDIFARVGKKDDTFFPWNDGDVKNGVDAVKGTGKELEGIANSLKTFTTIDMKSYQMLYKVVPGIISIIPLAFADIYEKIKGKEEGVRMVSKLISSSLIDISSSVEGLTKNFEDKRFNEGYIGRLGGDLQKMFDQITDKVNPQRITNLRTFSVIIANLSKIVDPFTKFQKAFSMFSTDMKNFSENFSKVDVNKWQTFADGISSANNPSSNFSTTSMPYIDKSNAQQMEGLKPLTNGFTEEGVNFLIDKYNQSKANGTLPVSEKSSPSVTSTQMGNISLDMNALAEAIVTKMNETGLRVSPMKAEEWKMALNR